MERSKNYTRVVESVGRLRKKHSYEYHGLAQFITFDRYVQKIEKIEKCSYTLFVSLYNRIVIIRYCDLFFELDFLLFIIVLYFVHSIFQNTQYQVIY